MVVPYGQYKNQDIESVPVDYLLYVARRNDSSELSFFSKICRLEIVRRNVLKGSKQPIPNVWIKEQNWLS